MGDGRADLRVVEPGARLAAALLRVAGTSPAEALADRLCAEAVRVLGLRGASLGVLFVTGMAVPVGVSGLDAARAEEVQFSEGEGPCWEALRTGLPAVLPDVRAVPDGDRWAGYARALAALTAVRGVVAVPAALASGLQVTLCAYYDGAVEDVPAFDADRVAVALQRVLDEASPPEEEGGAAWLDSSTTLRRGTVWLAEAQLMRRAAGMGHDEALGELRAHSRRTGGTVDDVAADLVRGLISAEDVLRPR